MLTSQAEIFSQHTSFPQRGTASSLERTGQGGSMTRGSIRFHPQVWALERPAMCCRLPHNDSSLEKWQDDEV